MVSSSHDCPIALELYWNGFNHIFLIIHSLCKLMVHALFLMFLSSVYCRGPFLACCYIQWTRLLLARLLDVIKCSITFMLMTLSYTLRSGRLLFLIWIWEQCNTKLINCVQDMDAWMLSNKLKLNKDKSEVLVISSSYRPRPPLCSVDIRDETVSCSPSARNIGVIFDQSLCMVPHVNAVFPSS